MVELIGLNLLASWIESGWNSFKFVSVHNRERSQLRKVSVNETLIEREHHYYQKLQ